MIEVAMRYIIKLKIIPQLNHEARIRSLLQKHRLTYTEQDAVWEISFEKGDNRLMAIQGALAKMGYDLPPFYEAQFQDSEVEESEILHLFIRGLCGMSFAEWAKELGMPAGTRVMDKREMRNQDIALTFGFEIVITGRLRDILGRENLTGWDAQPISHRSPQEDRYPPLFHLSAINELPSLAPEASLLRIQRSGITESLNRSLGSSAEALFQSGPLEYRKQDLQKIDDLNRTREQFGEPEQSQPLLVISQRAWRVFRKYRVKNVDVEPVIIHG